MISKEKRKKIEEIKHLQENNYQKNYVTWMTYYKEFHRPKSQKNPIKLCLNRNPKSNDNFFYFRLKSKISQIYKDDDRNKYLNTFNPYVTMMMTNATNLTQYNHKEYVKSNRITNSKTQTNFSSNQTEYNNNIPKKKKIFGLDAKTPLYDNEQFDNTNTDNFKMSTLNDLYMKTSMGMKTLGYLPQNKKQNFNSKYNYNMNKIKDRHYTIEDDEYANDIFFDGNARKEERRYKKDNINKFYKDFSVEKKLTLEEQNEIEEKIKNNNDIQIRTINARDYRDPFKSKKRLKINSQMSNIVEKIRLDLQCQKFQKEYNTISKFNIRKNRMPNVKIIQKKLQKIDIISALKMTKAKTKKKNLPNKQEEIFINLKEYISHKMQEQFVHSINKTSRYDHEVSDFKLDIGIIPISHHPELRTFSSICYDESKSIIYLYGGIGGKKFGDIWECKYENKKINLKRIYNPIFEEEGKYEDMENKEPLPRYGHTIHLVKNKIYVCGGEFDNWNKRKYKNEFLWIYDLNRHKWELDEYKINNNKKLKKVITNENEFARNNLKYYFQNNKTVNINSNNSNKLIQKLKTEKSKSYKNISNNNLWLKNSKYNNLNQNKKNEKEDKKVIFPSNKLLSNKSRNKDKIVIPSILNKNEINNNIYNNNDSNISENSGENKILCPCLRRNHASLIIGNFIFVYGGISPEKKFLNDCWIYDMNKGKWDLVDFIGRYPPPLGFHSCCIALEKDQLVSESLTIYNKPSSNRKTLPLLKLDGIFFFGGINETKIPTNLFFHMSLGIKPAIFDIPPTNGRPPSPRVSSSMDFSPDCNMIIIHGGKNELKNDNFMNDITLLDLETLDWIHPICNNFMPPERAEHLSTFVGNQLVIFGGTSAENLLNFDFIIVNLDI